MLRSQFTDSASETKKQSRPSDLRTLPAEAIFSSALSPLSRSS